MNEHFKVSLLSKKTRQTFQSLADLRRWDSRTEILLEPVPADGFHMQTEPEEYDEFKYVHCIVYCLGLIRIHPD